jgi:hypothetical protein
MPASLSKSRRSAISGQANLTRPSQKYPVRLVPGSSHYGIGSQATGIPHQRVLAVEVTQSDGHGEILSRPAHGLPDPSNRSSGLSPLPIPVSLSGHSTSQTGWASTGENRRCEISTPITLSTESSTMRHLSTSDPARRGSTAVGVLISDLESEAPRHTRALI